MALFEKLGRVYYSPSIVTMVVSCIVLETTRDRKSQIFFIPLAFDAPFKGFLSEY